MHGPAECEHTVESLVGEGQNVIVPLVVRMYLPTPDAVIVRHESGEVTVFADVAIPEQRVAEIAAEAAAAPEVAGRALS